MLPRHSNVNVTAMPLEELLGKLAARESKSEVVDGGTLAHYVGEDVDTAGAALDAADGTDEAQSGNGGGWGRKSAAASASMGPPTQRPEAKKHFPKPKATGKAKK